MKLSNRINSLSFLNFYFLNIVLLFLFSISIHASETSDLKYRVLKGENQKNEQLLVLLHGMNSNTQMWDEFVPLVPKNTLMIAIEAPFKTDNNKYRWYDIDVSKKPFVSNINQMVETTNRLEKLINSLKLLHSIDSENTVIAGFSQGAILSLNYSLTNPGSVRNIGVFSGMLPDSIEDRVSKTINKVSVFLTHGSLDKGIEISYAEEIQMFLKQKNIQVKMTIEEIEHTVTNKQFQDFINWFKPSYNPK